MTREACRPVISHHNHNKNMGDDCKPVFSSIGCLYIKSSVWKKSSALSRVTVYEVPACVPPFRLVLTSVATVYS